jgi:chemotaxis signal transduction protein
MVTTLAPATLDGAAQVGLVRVAIGGRVFALPMAGVAAVLEPTMLAPARAPGLWLGEIESRLGAIAVVDTAQLLGLEAADMTAGRVLVLRGERPTGIAVDRVLDSIAVQPADIVALPEPARRSEPALVGAVVWVGDGEIELLLDVDRLARELLRLRDGLPRATPQPVHALTELRRRLASAPTGRLLALQPAPEALPVAVPVAAVRHVADFREPYPLPLAGADVLGLLAWQRQPIPVIDLAARLGMAAPAAVHDKVVVVGEPAVPGPRAPGALAALAVHQIGELHNADAIAPGGYLRLPEGQARVVDLAELLLDR